MITLSLLEQQRKYLAELLEAIQRCAYFLDAADRSLTWPLDPLRLEQAKKDTVLFGTLAAINERFAKLQDTLGAAMRHAMGLLAESPDTFLKVLVFYEKLGVIDSTEAWQTCRTARNLAAHAYETDYVAIAAHFNMLHEMRSMLCLSAGRFVAFFLSDLNVEPVRHDFTDEFSAIAGSGLPER